MQNAAKFWETYNQWVIDVRHGKFGATLTGNELKAFNDIIARPSNAPEMIRNNLSRQQTLLERALARKMNSQVQQGVNAGAVETSVGWGSPKTGSIVNTAPQTPQGGLPRVTNDEEYAVLRRGDKYIHPDGSTRTKQ